MGSSRISVRAGGLSLIVGAIAFMGVFSYLAARFNYPEVLDGAAPDVLPRLLATGPAGRTVWAIYAFLPLFWIPAGVGAYRAYKRSHPGAMMLALQFAVVASFSMMLGLMRWPSMHWRLAQLYATADAGQRSVLDALFDGFNTYLGNYIGEFLGEVSISVFFFISAWAMLKSGAASRWLAFAGIATSVLGVLGAFRNVTSAVVNISEINNFLLPLWMIVFGVILLRHRGPAPTVGA
ncbi:MAG TPA: DUF4386 family protein [Gemmatimonadaceae bacterium]|nr:DUF4386 family protein [Gemmatimonadaceae bacterium]